MQIYLPLFTLALVVSGAAVTSSAAFQVDIDSAPVEQYELGVGYDILSGEGRQKCFAGAETDILTSDSRLTLRLLDEQSKESRAKTLVQQLSIKAKGNFGPVKAKARISSYTSSFESRSSSSRSVIVRMEWRAETGKRRFTSVTLNDFGKAAYEKGLAHFISKCGAYIAVEQSLSIMVVADLIFSFASSELKTEFVSKLSGSIGGSYAGFSGSASGSRELKEGLEASRSAKDINVMFWTRSQQGTKGVGAAIGQLAAAEADPFVAALKSMEELAKGMTDDRGGISGVSFTPVTQFIPDVSEFEADKVLAFLQLAGDYISVTEFMQEVRGIVRRYRQDFDSTLGSASSRMDVVSRSAQQYEPRHERMLVDYVANRCMELTYRVSLFGSFCHTRNPLIDRTTDITLQTLKDNIVDAAERCIAASRDACRPEILVALVLRSEIVQTRDDVNKIFRKLKGMPKARWDEVVEDADLSVESLQWAASQLEAHVGSDERWIWPIDGGRVKLHLNLFAPEFTIDDFQWFVDDLAREAPVEVANRKGAAIWLKSEPRLDANMSDPSVNIIMQLLAPIMLERMVASVDGKVVFSCGMGRPTFLAAGTVLSLGMGGGTYVKREAINAPAESRWRMSMGCGHAINGIMQLQKDSGQESYEAIIEMEGIDFWGPAKWMVGRVSKTPEFGTRFESGE